MRLFRSMLVVTLIGLPIVVLTGVYQNSPLLVLLALAAVAAVYVSVAVVLRSRLIGWTLLGCVFGFLACGAGVTPGPFRSEREKAFFVILTWSACGVVAGFVHDSRAEERNRLRHLRMISPNRPPLIHGSLELLWNDNYVGTVTDAVDFNPPWCAGRFITSPHLSEELRLALQWMTAQSRSEVDLADPPAEHLREGWTMLERSGRMIKVRPLVDWDDLSIVWEHPDFLHGASREVGLEMAVSSRHPPA